jgi:hypothetical protein
LTQCKKHPGLDLTQSGRSWLLYDSLVIDELTYKEAATLTWSLRIPGSGGSFINPSSTSRRSARAPRGTFRFFLELFRRVVTIELGEFCRALYAGQIAMREILMIYRGVEYSVAMTTTPGIWKWQFRIGDELKTGKTETKIGLLAIRRVQIRIDRALKLAATRVDSATESLRPATA